MVKFALAAAEQVSEQESGADEGNDGDRVTADSFGALDGLTAGHTSQMGASASGLAAKFNGDLADIVGRVTGPARDLAADAADIAAQGDELVGHGIHGGVAAGCKEID